MQKLLFNLNVLALLVLVTFIGACNKETEDLVSEEEILGIRTIDLDENDLALAFSELEDVPFDALDVEAMPVHHPEKCFSFNYPLTISFPDETTYTANSKEELRAAIKAWREANPGVHKRPALVYPVSLTLKDGTVVTVDSTQEMRNIVRECAKRWRHVRIWACLDLVYPVTLVFPDETTLVVNSKEELKNAIVAWRENNPDIAGRPHIQFPFNVTLKNGDVVTINNLDELKDLIKQCIKKRRFIRF
jgi:hypothetical protein